MNCSSCRQENPADSRFCESCGAVLEARCPACGAGATPGANFCRKCGHSLSGKAPLPPTRGEAPEPSRGERPFRPSDPDSPRLPRDYTPKHLAEKILTSKSALEGERKQVTVLFADVKGSMDLAEQVDPEEWHRILNRFFEILTDGVHRFEGTVNQYTGDGIMALFGAPITHEDHAHRACYAALHLSNELRQYSEELKRTQGLNFAARMGINSGEVVVGKIGDDLRMDYTAQGHTVGLASRLEQLADSGKAYVSENTGKLVSGFFDLRDLGQFELKGVREPIRVYELQGVGRMRTRLDVSRARGLSHFVGRAGEMETLERALESVLAGNAQAVGVVADAGTGKSRLCYEFLEKARGKGLRVREARCVAHGKSIPFVPVFEFLRGFFGVTEHDRDEDARRKIAGTLLLLEKDLTEALPVLFEFLGIADPAHPAPKMDPDARQRQLFALTRRILHARNQLEPGLILVEDLHWIDGGSEVFLEQLLEALPGTRTLLMVNFRPEYQPAWLQKSYYQQIPLLPLGPKEISELLEHLLGRHPSLGDLPDRIRNRTAGNPFFIEEIIRSLEESGTLEGVKGAYRLVGPVDDVVMPASVQAVLGARVDRLAEREKRVLQTAAVIGKEFPEPVLKRVSDLPDLDLAEALRALMRAEYIYEESLYPDLEYAFRHPLTQEVAYGSQLADRRARIHGAVGRALVEHYADRVDERAALIAHHFEQAGEVLEAARWHQLAAEWAGLRDPAEAFRHWRRVRALLLDLPESPETVGLGLLARIQIMSFGFRMGLASDEFEAVFEEGASMARNTNNLHALAMLMSVRDVVSATSGEITRLMKDSVESLRVAEETEDPGLILAVRSGRAYALLSAGNMLESWEAAREVLENPPEDPNLGASIAGISPYIQTMFIGSFTLTYLGRTKEALAMLRRCIDLAEENGQMEIAGWATGTFNLAAYLTGDGGGTLEAGRKAIEIADRIGSNVSLVTARWALAVAHIVLQEWQLAIETMEEALALSRVSQAGRFVEPRLLSYLSEAYLHLGEVEKARATAEEAVRVSQARGFKNFEAAGQLALARVLMASEGAAAADDVESRLQWAHRFAEEMGARYWLPFIAEARAELAALRGDGDARERALREAHRLFEEMDATVNAARIAKAIGAS